MHKIKDHYVSRYDGGQLAQFDLSQIEIVVLAFLSQDANMIQDLKDGVDFHCKRLAYVTKRNYKDLVDLYRKGDPLVIDGRKKVKEVSFQMSYGASINSVCKTTGLSKGDVALIFKAEENLYPGVGMYYDDLINKISNKIHVTNGAIFGVLKSQSGKEYQFEKMHNSYNYSFSKPKVLNYPVQGLAAEIIKLVLQQFYVYLYDHFVNNSILLINTTHDDVLFDTSSEYRVQHDLVPICQKVLRVIPHLLSKYLRVDWNVPIRGTLSYGRTWGSLTNQINLETI